MDFNILNFDKYIHLVLTIQEKEKFEKYAIFLEKHLNKKSRKMFRKYLEKNNLKIKCPVCNKKFTLNGYMSHGIVHKEVKQEVVRLFNNYFKNIKCVVCEKQIKLDYIKDRSKNPYFCSNNCLNATYCFINRVKKIRKCAVCDKYIFNNNKKIKTCSRDCYLKLHSKLVKQMWDNRSVEDIKRISNKMVKTRKTNGSYNYNGKVWNKGLKGQEYLKHYEKNGINILYEAIKNNGNFFKKTKPEMIFKEQILDELEFKYQHHWFSNGSQYDFIISTNNLVFIVEIDGDYWHCNSRRCSDKEKVKMKRLEDKLKEQKLKNYNFKKKFLGVLRIWEHNVYENLEYIKSLFINLKKEENIEDTICEIKEYYKNES